MEKPEITKNKLNKLKKDFQNFEKSENPFLNTNLPKFFKKILTTFIDVYFVLQVFIGQEIIGKRIQMHRDFMPKNIKKVKMPPELTIDFLDTKEIHNKYEATLQTEVDTFLEILEKHFKAEDLAFFFRNIRSLDFKKVKQIKGSSIGTNTLGYYMVRNNKITLLKDFNTNTIIHELFHMASSYRDKKNDVSYSGFRQKGKGIDLGNGINEGYTELLANRYSNIVDSNCYIFESEAAKILEKIIGKDLMQSLYLQANLKGLITELSKYQTEEKIKQFLQNLDLWEKYKYDTNLSHKMDNCLKNIGTFLLEIYLEKTKRELKETYLKKEDNLQNFLQKIREYLYDTPLFSTLFSIEEIDSFFAKFLNNTIAEKKEQIEKYKWDEMEVKIKQEQAEWEQKFGNFNFTSQPTKVEPIKDFDFSKLPDDIVPKR